MIKEPSERLTADEILAHPWMVSEGSKILPAVPKNMKEYNARRRLKQAGYAIIAIGRLNKIVKNWNNQQNKQEIIEAD